MPYMMLEMFENTPGMAGLFVSAVYAGSLSSVSSGVNAMATVTMEDMIMPLFKDRFGDRSYTWISKAVVVVFGLLSIGMAFLLSTTTELLQAAFSFMGLTTGPLVGIFTLGIHFPFANSTGAITGLLAGLASAIWYYIGSKRITMSNSLLRKLPLRIDECSSTCGGSSVPGATNATGGLWNFSTTTMHPYTTTDQMDLNFTSSGMEGDVTGSSTPPQSFNDDVPFYTLSYHYISAIGLCTTLAVGLIVSLITCGWKHRKQVDTRLLRPPCDHWALRPCLPEKVRKFFRFGIEWKDNIGIKKEEFKMNERKDQDEDQLSVRQMGGIS